MNEFITALNVLEKEKNIDKEELIEAIEISIESAYKKNYGNQQNVLVEIDREDGEISVYSSKLVVEEVEDPSEEILLDKAREINPTINVGDYLQEKVTPKDFGRIAAQNAKQLIVQRIKEAERNIIYKEFLESQDEILNGIVTRVNKGLVYIDVGNSEAVLMPSEQSPGEVYQPGQRLKVYLIMVKKTTKGPHINVSRTHPGMVKRLFESEVPEIYEGLADIVSIAREAGSRTKMSVKENDPNIDAVGACVGPRGIRVQNVISELNGEKIDIIKYSDDIEEYLANALSPAKVIKIIPNHKEKTAIAVADDMQLSLAIGKEGQNVRLAAKLTGWKIDIKSKSDYDRMVAENPNFDEEYQGLDESFDSGLTPEGMSLDDVLNIDISDDQEDLSIREDDFLDEVLDDLLVTDTDDDDLEK